MRIKLKKNPTNYHIEAGLKLLIKKHIFCVAVFTVAGRECGRLRFVKKNKQKIIKRIYTIIGKLEILISK